MLRGEFWLRASVMSKAKIMSLSNIIIYNYNEQVAG